MCVNVCVYVGMHIIIRLYMYRGRVGIDHYSVYTGTFTMHAASIHIMYLAVSC